ncbi:tRNA (cytosine(72)-C(5))-methyltransferase NSUN6-like isoform X1 [Thrips palmi]|uniref:tRNA (Cytosine(72)-C(5))-methyltransferase NSUN6-like isoform X1 n=1 Tax=Thrips palmi TaxID=161013 RepID=A0A6P8YLK1_THRPL|nr:tRNA (cytosine(72)-C(5))-methyltransferase NSUN6-like isoform X1 [Thrips palmi]
MLPAPSENRGLSFEDDFSKLLVWRRRTPKFTTFRVNSLTTNPVHFLEILKQSLAKLAEDRSQAGTISAIPPVWQHPKFPEAVAFGCWDRSEDLPRHDSEVIVDRACGAAVLRGAHVFVPGVIGLLPGAREGDIVSIYADICGVSKRGWTQKLNEKSRMFVGNGVLLMDRKQIFCENGFSRGIAVLVTDNESGCPSLPENLFEPGMAIMQNLPSIVCGRVVDPQPGEIILDMCAAPGNKTTHLSALMNNEGAIIALDRSASRISKLRQVCLEMSVRNVAAFVFDSVKAVKIEQASGSDDDCNHSSLERGPPFSPCLFDRILLDAPCSGLGQRPKLEEIDMKHVASFPPLQKKLFKTAVSLLKPGGILVYSTCTVTVEENEGVVRWALDHFSSLTLLPAEPRFFNSALNKSASSNILSSTELSCIQKFVPSVDTDEENNHCERDTIGFFIARFQKQT